MGEKGKLFFTTKCQLINVKEVMKLKKKLHHLATITVIIYLDQNQ